jgi:hypothetical protein
MSCGTRIVTHDRYDLADALEREGEYTLSSKVRRDECLDSYDLRRTEDILGRRGFQRHWDYSERNCYCDEDERDG